MTAAAGPVARGRFITLEGGEGAGKSTQLALLARFLEGAGVPLLRTREPGGSTGAEAIRTLILTGAVDRWDARTEALLVAAARRDHVERTIRPALEQGTWVLCDRFFDSTMAYQGIAGGVDPAAITWLRGFATDGLTPDLTILLDLPVEIGIARTAARADGRQRFELREPAFHERLRQAFQAIAAAEPARCRLLDAREGVDALAAAISALVATRFDLPPGMSEAAPDAFAPVSSPCLFGLEPAERAFLRAWRSGRMPHAWLVTGPRGVGKATLVHRFARFVLSGGDGDAGGLFGDPPDTLAVESPRARHIAAGGHPDLRVVTRGLSDRGKLRQEIVIDDIRDLGHFLHLTPAGGGWRVAIVDAADDLNRNAANALLKVLEEPPRNALLLLTSHSPGRLLPTIRSRCRRLALEPLPPAAVEEGLRAIRPGIADDAVPALVQLAEGSIGRAVSLADMDGVEAYRDLLDLLGQWPRMELPALMGWADRFTRGEGEGFALARELLSGLLARVVALGAGRPLPEAVAGELAVTRRLVEGARLDRWVTLWEKTNDLFARADGLDLDRKHALLSSLLAFETVRSAG